MATRDELLTPIPGDNPGGVELRYDPLYDRIKEARRQDDDAPQGAWQRERKAADWSAVLKLTGEALATKSKDLQLAAWWTEASLRRTGVAGLRDGLDLLNALTLQFWDYLYPPLEDGDAELRAAPLEWVGAYLGAAVLASPLTRSGLDYFRFTEARAVPTEAETEGDEAKTAARAKAIEDGKTTPEAFDQAADATPKAYYKQLNADLSETFAALQALDDTGRAKFGDVAPSYTKLRESLEQLQRAMRPLLARKLEREPDAPGETVSASAMPPAASGDMASPRETNATAPGPMNAGAVPATLDDAAVWIAGAARFLRRTDAKNPASYMLLRGFRWGELRARGASPDPRLLDAPLPATRTALKRLLLDSQWPELLEGAEEAMATPAGRGWLDLQRYVVAACEGLGGSYDGVARAVREALQSLLGALPQLIDMTLMDDSATANPDTRAWLASFASQASSIGGPAVVAAPARVESQSSDAMTRAVAEVRAGHPERAVELLTRELASETSRRGRFLRQTDLAMVMVDARLEGVAKPVLEELVGQIDTYRLEEWESPSVVSLPLALLLRCLKKLDGDAGSEAAQALYLRICRVDPLQAVRISPT